MKLSVEQIKQAIREAIDPKQWMDITSKLNRLPVADRDIAMQKMLGFLVRGITSGVATKFVQTFKDPAATARGAKQGGDMPGLASLAKQGKLTQPGEEQSEDEPELKSGGIIPAQPSKLPRPETITQPDQPSRPKAASQTGQDAAQQYLQKKSSGKGGIDFDPSLMKALKKGKEPKVADTKPMKDLSKAGKALRKSKLK